MLFTKFSEIIHARYLAMQKHELYEVADFNITQVYLDAFPEGSNPLYKHRTEHECTCCFQFLRGLGRAVSLQAGVQTLWSVDGLQEPYRSVAAALDAAVLSQPIVGLYRTDQRQYGKFETLKNTAPGDYVRFNHFEGRIAKEHFSTAPAKDIGEYNAKVQVFRKGLTELRLEDLDTVIDLIQADSLYRGEESLERLQAFKAAMIEYAKHPAKEQYVWQNAGAWYAVTRNTAIGSLLIDLAEGKELEDAVASFENKVSGTNYKRPKALVTPAMVKTALATLKSLGLESALDRRHAKISDVSVNNVLWVDGSVQSRMKDALEATLLSAVAAKPDADKAEEISIEEFMSKVLPKALAVDMLVQSQHVGNLVNLTAPCFPDSGRLFKWDNDFAWSYNGNITDSIKERVKAAGGNVDAKLRVSLGWHNPDDLDLHCAMPNKGHIYFGNKQGILDVDMNAFGYKNEIDPVENMAFTSLQEGVYNFCVKQYAKRSTVRPGFEIEVELGGKVFKLVHAKDLRQDGEVLFQAVVKRGEIESVSSSNKDLVEGSISKEVWGLTTEKLAKVQTVMHSPNFWDANATGNKHWVFVLDQCKNPEPVRGIYNEFLRAEFEQHRKTFELIGSKTMCEYSDEQLSGLGFSSTQRAKVLVKVTSVKSSRLYNISF